jgi:hypothetical protein
LLSVLGCGGSSTRYEYFGSLGAGGSPSGNGVGAAGSPELGGSSVGDAADSVGSSSASGRGGDVTDADSDGGIVDAARATDAADAVGVIVMDAADGPRACLVAPDCPTPPNPCVASTCIDGQCGQRYLAAGAVYIRDTPPDCHAATSCDGSGHAVLVVDQDNVTTPANPCLAGTCNKAGTPGTEALRARIPCTSPPNGRLCDGAGKCVECLLDADCPDGLTCAAWHECIAGPCTDQDCGGSCQACALGKKCLFDRDCISNACDAVSLTCITDPCLDHRRDGLESDVDCGGRNGCARCGQNKHCEISADCQPNATCTQNRVCQ